MMYQGQWRSLAVPAPRPIGAMRDLIEAFHRSHEREYNFRRDDAPVGLFRLNLKAIGIVPKAELAAHAPTGATPRADEPALGLVRRGGRGSTRPSTSATTCRRAFRFKGPAVVEQVDSTVVIPPGTTASVDKYLNIIIRVTE